MSKEAQGEAMLSTAPEAGTNKRGIFSQDFPEGVQSCWYLDFDSDTASLENIYLLF